MIFLIFILYWTVVHLQCCVSFRCTAKWFSYIYTCIYSFSNSFKITQWGRQRSTYQPVEGPRVFGAGWNWGRRWERSAYHKGYHSVALLGKPGIKVGGCRHGGTHSTVLERRGSERLCDGWVTSQKRDLPCHSSTEYVCFLRLSHSQPSKFSSNRITIWSGNSTPGIYWKESKTEAQTDNCTPMFIAVLFTRGWKQLKFPPKDEWINKMGVYP